MEGNRGRVEARGGDGGWLGWMVSIVCALSIIVKLSVEIRL